MVKLEMVRVMKGEYFTWWFGFSDIGLVLMSYAYFDYRISFVQPVNLAQTMFSATEED
jgi:hypothetical protein